MSIFRWKNQIRWYFFPSFQFLILKLRPPFILPASKMSISSGADSTSCAIYTATMPLLALCKMPQRLPKTNVVVYMDDALECNTNLPGFSSDTLC